MALLNPIKAKSVIFDIADNHGDAGYMGITAIDFWYKGAKLFQYPTHTFTADATSELVSFEVENAFDCTLLKTGVSTNRSWVTATAVTNQRLIIVFDEEIEFDEIRVNNFHSSGGSTTRGANNVKIYASLDAITDTVYGNSINRSRLIFDATFTEHVATNTEDEENLDLTIGFAYLSEVACADNVEFFQRIRDFICKRNGTYDYSTTGIGWTLYDSSYAVDEDNISVGDWFVVHTQGELGDFDYYLYFEYATTTIKTQAGTYWNSTTNAMAGDPGQSSASNTMSITSTDTPILGVYGNLDCMVIFGRKTAVQTTTYLWVYGRVETIGPSDYILTATSTYTAGSDVSITFNEELPDDWIVGNSIFLWSGQGDGFDVAELKTVNTGTKTITVDLGSNLPTATIRGSRHFALVYATNSAAGLSPYTLIGNNGSENQALQDRSLYLETNLYMNITPDPLDDIFYCSFVYLWYDAGFIGKVPFMISIPQFGTTTPAVSDTMTIDDRTYKVLSNVRGSARYALLETI